MVERGDIVRIPERLIEQMYQHARSTFPSECCGYILGHAERAQLVVCQNRQDQLHQLDPATYPRTSANAYNIGGKELLQLVRSFESDLPATIIYHSHPRVGAYFSEEDTRAAEVAGYPVDYLVIDAQEQQIREALLFRRRPDKPIYEAIDRYDGMPI